MNKTPNSNRMHIGFYGKRNAGKSSILNAVAEQDISVVSNIKGTTTDPVRKAMEIISLGPVLFIDTAGIDDEGALGEKRIEKTLKMLHETDFAVYIMDANDADETAFNNMRRMFKKYNIPYMLVVNKMDTVSQETLSKIKEKHKDAHFISVKQREDIKVFRNVLTERVKKLDTQERSMIGDIVPYGGKVVMVVPIDSEAPKGRLILPQVQLLRDCLNYGIKSYVTRDTELTSALNDLKDVDLVVTDSQAFKKVHELVPSHINLTSFSILMSRIKGDLETFVYSVRKLEDLKDGARILIAESCTHNSTCDDIGRVKIPRGIKNHTGKSFEFDVMSGKDFPTDLSSYDFVIHCASCMLNRKSMQTRIKICSEKNIPITNYGVLLAYLSNILPRATQMFDL